MLFIVFGAFIIWEVVKSQKFELTNAAVAIKVDESGYIGDVVKDDKLVITLLKIVNSL